MIRTLLALKELERKQNERYLKSTPEEKTRIKEEEWGLTSNPTQEQIKNRRDCCEFTESMFLVTYSTLAGLVPSLYVGFAATFYVTDSDSLDELLAFAFTATTITGVAYASRKIGNFLHKRKHPSGRECYKEYVQINLEKIAELERNYSLRKEF